MLKLYHFSCSKWIFLHLDSNCSTQDEDSFSNSTFETESDLSDNEYDDFNSENSDNQPIYEGARVTRRESFISVFMLMVRHKLSNQCLDDVLKLISLHCPEKNKCISSIYKFRQFFKEENTPVQRNYYCNKCLTVIENSGSCCAKCENVPAENDYFITVPIIDQVEKLYSREDFQYHFNEYIHRKKNNENNLEDIVDGRIYKEMLTHQKANPEPSGSISIENITFTWYTDGVAVFKSSKYNIWPFFLTINELPFRERYKLENLIICGLWFGETKPVPNLYLSPMFQEFKKLHRGISLILLYYVPLKIIITNCFLLI